MATISFTNDELEELIGLFEDMEDDVNSLDSKAVWKRIFNKLVNALDR